MSSSTSQRNTTDPISVTSLPILQVIDLTRRSSNMRKVLKGAGLADLESEIIEDKTVGLGDLAIIEMEVNKKRKKKHKAEQKNQLISPASSVRSSV